MPNAPWAQSNQAPSITNVYPAPAASDQAPAGSDKQYGKNTITPGDHPGGDPSLIYAGGTVVEDTAVLDQLRNVLLGDPVVAQQVLTQMGWPGTVDEFKALSDAQINVWAWSHSAAGKKKLENGGRPGSPTGEPLGMYKVFATDPKTGVTDFTKWFDGTPSGYDANMMADPKGAQPNIYQAYQRYVYDKYLPKPADWLKGAGDYARGAGVAGPVAPTPMPITPGRITQPGGPQATAPGFADPAPAPGVSLGTPNPVKPVVPPTIGIPKPPAGGGVPPEFRIR